MAEPTQAPVTRLQAQIKLGLFAPHDIVTVILLSWIFLGTLVWCSVGSPSLVQVLVLLVLGLIVAAIWIVILAFRILVFILDMQADVNLMPETAARMAVAYLQNPAPKR